MLKPLFDRVMIEELQAEMTQVGSLHLPDSATDKLPRRGIVKAVGDGKEFPDGTVRPLKVKPGDKVAFYRYPPEEATLDGRNLILIHESDILGIEVEG